jgi:nicotinamide riboside transporter PnuC
VVGNRVTLYPWEYTYEARTDRETRTVTMTSAVRWVLSFTSAYTLSLTRQALANKGERRPEHIRQFVVNALVAQLVITGASRRS